MVIISDTSPIINLARIGQLSLLQRVFSRIVIPQAVFDEITIGGKGEPGSSEILHAEWVDVVRCRDSLLLVELREQLDEGEAEAIALAIEMNADLLIVDEPAGRSIAKQKKIVTTGLLGVLIRAKEKGLVISVRSLMDRLRHEANFRISDELYDEVVHLAQEK